MERQDGGTVLDEEQLLVASTALLPPWLSPGGSHPGSEEAAGHRKGQGRQGSQAGGYQGLDRSMLLPPVHPDGGWTPWLIPRHLGSPASSVSLKDFRSWTLENLHKDEHRGTTAPPSAWDRGQSRPVGLECLAISQFQIQFSFIMHLGVISICS